MRSTKALKKELAEKVTRKCGYNKDTPAGKAMVKQFIKLTTPTLLILSNHMRGK